MTGARPSLWHPDRLMSFSRRSLTHALGAAATCVALAACSGSSSPASAPRKPSSPKVGEIRAVPALVVVKSAGAEVPFPDADRVAVLRGVETYVNDATLAPLKGTRSDVAKLFAPDAAPPETALDYDAFGDASLPKATGRVTATLEPVSLIALADPTGAIDLIGATVDLTVSATTKPGPIHIHRTGELMFTRDGGEWRILSFKLAVTRDGAGLGTASTTTSGSTAP